MKCPVCKTDCSPNIIRCPRCGFNDLRHTFINVSEAEYWTNTIVNEYRIKWISSTKNFVFDKTYSVLLKYMGSEEHVMVPYGVTEVKDAFSQNANIRTVHLPASVKHIGDSAFFACRNLSAVNIPNGVKTIGASAFAFCPMLDISLPMSVEEIAEGSLANVHSISVDSSNNRIKMLSGMLIDEEKKVLLAVSFPSPYMDVIVPSFVRRIGTRAFFIN